MIKKLFVTGSGLMGMGITQVAAQSGINVTVNDVSDKILETNMTRLHKSLEKSVEKNRMTESEKNAVLDNIHLSTSIDPAADCDLVIEAIYENMEAKKKVFNVLTDIVSDECILASNTSSLSIAEISSAVKYPQRFIGMHFFSPVPAMQLLEIVRGLNTSTETVEAAKDIGKQLGKICIIAKDKPGFVVNRLLDPMINEAIGLVENGTALPEDIDSGMKYGCHHPMGPLELIDMVGIDIELAVMQVLYKETGDQKYRPSGLLKDMVRMGWLGKKTGIGFYIYDADGSRHPNPNI